MHINNLAWLDSHGQLRMDALKVRNGRLLIGQPEICSMPTPTCQLKHLVVPGFIDAHVHFRQPGQEYKEGISNGCMAALAGGVTTVLDMPNNLPSICTAASLKTKRQLWTKSGLIGWGLFLGCNGSELAKTSPISLKSGLRRIISINVPTPVSLGIDPSEIAALKVFMARSGDCAAVTMPEQLAALMISWPRIAVHAEDETCFPADGVGISHRDRRPRAAVISALRRLETALELAEQHLGHLPDCRIILLHLCTKEEIEWVRRMKAHGYNIKAETCPHYLFFTAADLTSYGAKIQVNPPIRDTEDQAALWEGLRDGTIDILSSDHAPHTLSEKSAKNPPSGIPGIERMWPLLALAVETGQITWQRAIAVAAKNSASCYELNGRGEISNGARADLVVLRRQNENGNVPARKIVTRAGYDVYQHLQFPWEVERVLIAGKTAWEQSTRRAVPLVEEVYGVKSSC